jgi:hypothetical protein
MGIVAALSRSVGVDLDWRHQTMPVSDVDLLDEFLAGIGDDGLAAPVHVTSASVDAGLFLNVDLERCVRRHHPECVTVVQAAHELGTKIGGIDPHLRANARRLLQRVCGRRGGRRAVTVGRSR